MSEKATANASDEKQNNHKWRFVRIGGFDHVLLDTGEDIIALEQLDQKLWATLSCPTHGVEFDAKTLEYMDIDKDGRIRANEVISAVKWTVSLLKNPGDLIKGSGEIAIEAINVATADGKKLAHSAEEILKALKKSDKKTISLDDIADPTKIFAQTQFNGDGVITALSAKDAATKLLIEQIILCLGSVPDRSGQPGITIEKVEQFFVEAKEFSDWNLQSEKNAKDILPLGAGTAAAVELLTKIRAKVEDFFARCSLTEFDAKAGDSLNPTADQYDALSKQELSMSSQDIAAFPLAKVATAGQLPLSQGVNPAWIPTITLFRDSVVKPLLGNRDSLSYQDWLIINTRLNQYKAWIEAKKATTVEQLGLPRIREILGGTGRDTLLKLIEEDKKYTEAYSAITEVDKLLHYYRDLYLLLNNFVSFLDFYTPGKLAIFQAGTLFLDGRSCDLCIRVNDPGAHSALATLGRTYLAYCECTRKDSAEKIKIAAAFTEGDSDNLMVGRNGVFYDRKGRDWDATIVKIVEHPISVRQAFWAPYKRISKMIGEQIEKFASARDKAVDATAGAKIADAGATVEAGKAPAAAPFDVGKFAGIFAAIGLAVGAIGTAIASIVTGFISLAWWQMPLAIIGLMLAISGPSMIIAALKLRQRNLAPILDACGWAINTRARINIPFGSSLTQIAKLPKGANRSLTDPFAEKKRPWRFYIVVLVIIFVLGFLWQKGFLKPITDRILPPKTTEQVRPAEPAPAPAPPK